MLLSCAKFRPHRVIKKKRDNFADIGLAVGTPAGFAPRHVSSVCVGWANGTKRTPSQMGGPTIRATGTHEQCLTGFSDAFSTLYIYFIYIYIFFIGSRPSSSRAHCSTA